MLLYYMQWREYDFSAVMFLSHETSFSDMVLLRARGNRGDTQSLSRLHTIDGLEDRRLVVLCCLVGRQDVFLLIDVAEVPVEEHSHDAANDGRTSEVPDKVRISDDRGESQVDGICKSAVQEVDGGHQTSHVDGCTGVCNTVG
jgi:hypothetical protein